MFKYIKKPNRQFGVTLLELLTVITIIGILVGVGYPNYLEFKQESRRQDAYSGLTNALNVTVQEMVINNSADWASVTIPATSQNNYYTLAKVASNNPAKGSFMITATATGVQALDTACPVLTLYENGDKEPASCW